MSKASKILGMAAAVETGRSDAMVAYGLLDRDGLAAWGREQALLATVAAEHGNKLLEAQHAAAAQKARGLAGR